MFQLFGRNDWKKSTIGSVLLTEGVAPFIFEGDCGLNSEHLPDFSFILSRLVGMRRKFKSFSRLEMLE
jgi:hypothetical protein